MTINPNDALWHTVHIAAGGECCNINQAADGTLVVGTDGNGAYKLNTTKANWNPTYTGPTYTGLWDPLWTQASAPAALFGADSISGAYACQVAPSNSSMLYYMDYSGYIVQSFNGGATWNVTTMSPADTHEFADSFTWRQVANKFNVHPTIYQYCIATVSRTGLWNIRGGSTWVNVPTVPPSANAGTVVAPLYPPMTVLFAPCSLAPPGGFTAGYGSYASSYGNGFYESINGGISYASISGLPGAPTQTYVTGSCVGPDDGKAYYCVSDYSMGALGGGVGPNSHLVIFDPNARTWATAAALPLVAYSVTRSINGVLVIADQNGDMAVSYDTGAHWSFLIRIGAGPVNNGDTPWLARNPGTFMTLFQVYWDKAGGTIYAACGDGVYTSTVVPAAQPLGTWPSITTTGPQWTPMSAGIANLATAGITAAPGNFPIYWSRDFGAVQPANVMSLPSTNMPDILARFTAVCSVDNDPTGTGYFACVAEQDGEGGTPQSSHSVGGAPGSWTMFPSPPANHINGGQIVVFDNLHLLWYVPTSSAINQAPVISSDGGLTWTPITIPGFTDWSALGGTTTAYFPFSAEKATPGVGYMYCPGNHIGNSNGTYPTVLTPNAKTGVYKTTNYGVTWAYQSALLQTFGNANEGYNFRFKSAPLVANCLFYGSGYMFNAVPLTTPVAGTPMCWSNDGGVITTAIPLCMEALDIGFGAPAPGNTFPSVAFVGWYNGVYGVWVSTNFTTTTMGTFTNLATFPTGQGMRPYCIQGDPAVYGRWMIGWRYGGFAYTG